MRGGSGGAQKLRGCRPTGVSFAGGTHSSMFQHLATTMPAAGLCSLPRSQRPRAVWAIFEASPPRAQPRTARAGLSVLPLTLRTAGLALAGGLAASQLLLAPGGSHPAALRASWHSQHPQTQMPTGPRVALLCFVCISGALATGTFPPKFTAETLSRLASPTGRAVRGAQDAAAGAAQAGVGAASAAKGTLAGGTQEARQAVKGGAERAADRLQEASSSATDSVKGALQRAADAVKVGEGGAGEVGKGRAVKVGWGREGGVGVCSFALHWQRGTELPWVPASRPKPWPLAGPRDSASYSLI